MCLKSIKTTPDIAQEDIVCYKIVNFNYKSPYYSLEYSVNTTYINNMESEITSYGDGVKVGGGYYHTFKETESVVKYLETRGSFNRRTHLLRCIIPKGTEYYQNEFEYASRALKVIEEVC